MADLNSAMDNMIESAIKSGSSERRERIAIKLLSAHVSRVGIESVNGDDVDTAIYLANLLRHKCD